MLALTLKFLFCVEIKPIEKPDSKKKSKTVWQKLGDLDDGIVGQLKLSYSVPDDDSNEFSWAPGIIYISTSMSVVPKAATPVGSNGLLHAAVGVTAAATEDDDDDDDDGMEAAFA